MFIPKMKKKQGYRLQESANMYIIKDFKIHLTCFSGGERTHLVQ